MVDLQAGAEQQVHLAAAQGPEQGGGVAQGDQVDAPVGRAPAPVPGPGCQALLLPAEEGQDVGARAHEAVVQGLVPVLPVGGGGDRGQEDGAEQARQGAEGALQHQLDLVGSGDPHALDPFAQLVAEGADRHEAPQGERHGGGIEAGAVVEQHPSAQGDAGPQPIGAQHRQGRGQPRLDAAAGVDGIEGVPQAAEHLHHPDPGGLDRIEGIDAALGGHDQGVAPPGVPAARQQWQGQ